MPLAMLVNGEHRIGIYACTSSLHYIHLKAPDIISSPATKIMEHEELFINYGPKFFPTNKQEGEEDPSSLPHYAEHASDSTYSDIPKDDESGSN